MKRLRGAAWLGVDILLIALVGVLVWACRPPEADALTYRMCEQHLELCAKCRGRGLTPARMLARETPTTCLSFGAIPDQPEAYQSMPANAGQ